MPNHRKYSFSQLEHIKKTREFERLLKEGRKINNSLLTVYLRPNQLGYSRLGIIISQKRIKLAVRRNALKRLIREAFRLNKDKIPRGLDIIVNPRQTENIGLNEIARSLVTLVND